MEVIEVAGKLLGLAVADLGGGGGAESASEDEDTCWSREGSGASYEGGASDDDDGAGGKRKRMSTADRKARNRERNRLHARKTRQRKKQHVQELQLKIWGLRQERQRLLQLSTEHRTASVLLALSCSPKQCVQSSRSSITSSISSSSSSRETGASPRSPPSLKLPARDWGRELASHEDALRKITQEFESMDGSQQIGDDPCGTAPCDEVDGSGGGGGGGVGARGSSGKGSRGGKGTLADRTALRRERNRMHAKRTRNRKKLFVEACSVMIDKMKVENAQLEHEIQESGIRLPQESWVDEGQETVPEEPLPEYLAALWDFAEGKTHCPKPASPGTSVTDAMASPPATPTAAPTGMRYSRQTSSSSCTSSLSSASTEAPSSAHSSPVTTRPPPSVVNPGQALEDASTLCAFMEAAQTRSAKRPRVRVAPQEYPAGGAAGGASGTAQQHQQHQLQRQQQQHPRVWSDHGSTTSESRGSSESDEDAANERRSRSSASKHADGECAAGGGGVSGGDGGAMLSPAFWTSREVLERYVLPRQQLLRG